MFLQITDELRRTWHRARLYADVPGVLQHLRFKSLREEYYRELWRAAASNVGAHAEPWKSGYTKIERDGLATFVKVDRVMLDDHLLLDMMGNKTLTLELLRQKGAPTPTALQCDVSDLAAAEDFLVRCSGRVVVKPARGTGGGRGVTTGVSSRSALRKACRQAARYDPRIVIEEQIEGASFRLLFLDGMFVDAVRRDPPVVRGNGRDTIRRLIKMENKRRLLARPVSALSPLRIDRECVQTLATQGLTLRSKPASGQFVQLKGASNENAHAENHPVADLVHPETVAFAERLVSDLGVRFAGVDLICRDITQPLTRENGRINEINTTPGIHHHYLVSEPARRCAVAEHLLEHLFETEAGVMRLGQIIDVPDSYFASRNINQRQLMPGAGVEERA